MTTQTLEPQTSNGQCSAHSPSHPYGVRLNLGGGHVHLNGFVSIDRKEGQEVYPLAYADNSVDEIIASHVLEHFSHNQEAGNVLKHWIEKLKPGGRLRLAVPDFEELAKLYLAGAPVAIQSYVMGGHIDSDDRHGCLFDKETLTEMMLGCGLERISPWISDIPGCSSGPHSINLQGFKPSGPETRLENVRAVISVPRFGPLLHPDCARKVFFQLAIPCKAGQSCFWHQKISELMDNSVTDDPACEFVLTLDYDTVFCAADVLELYRLMKALPEADAIFPMQSRRCCEQVLFSLRGNDGNLKPSISAADLDRHLIPANSGHFGLTLFRASSLRKFPRPWMNSEPNEEGRWDEGHTDADIVFWRNFKAAGFKPFLAPRVVVGHLEETVKWPGKDLRAVYQTQEDYSEHGIPAVVAR